MLKPAGHFFCISPSNKKPVDNIDRFLAYLAADKGYSAETIVSYGRSLHDFEAFFHGLDAAWGWTDVDTDVVRQWVAARRAKGIHPRTMRHELSALRSFYRYAMRLGEAARNPAAAVRNPKADKPLPAFVREEEMDRLLDDTAYPDTMDGHRDRLLLLLLYTTGIRRGEAIRLNVEDIALDTGELKVTGKRNKQRIIPFGQELREALGTFIDERAACVERAATGHGIPLATPETARDAILPHSGPLLLDHDLRQRRAPYHRITARKLGGIVAEYLTLVTTQKRRSPHVLRHTFATVMLNNGADLGAVKELLGHESLAATEIYTHTTLAELRKEYARAHPRSRTENDKGE